MAKFLMKMETVNLANGVVEKSNVINMRHNEHRKFLDRHLTWCLAHGRGVQLFNVQDEELANGLQARAGFRPETA